jgi:3-oxoacyl-[acyl-carrier protein] reductase
MGDTYARLVNAPLLGSLAKRVGLPRPMRLERRHLADAPTLSGGVLLGAAAGARLGGAVVQALREIGPDVVVATVDDPARQAAADAGLDTASFNPSAPGKEDFKALVFDASGIVDSTELVELHRFLHPSVRHLASSGRVVVLGTPPENTASPREHTAQRALEGFTRALGKEVGRRGATVQLLYVGHGAEDQLGSTLRFLLSPRSAYVSGQVVRVGPPSAKSAEAGDQGSTVIDWGTPLAGKTALVTGAARGIGAAIAEVLTRDGARVVGLDVPAASADLRALMARLGGEPLELDITAPDAPTTIAAHFPAGLDVLVHNAGITRDRTLAKMPVERWSTLLEINLSSEERINDQLLAQGRLRPNGRIVCVSSIAGVAGNAGQTNYSTAKAGVIGMVGALAPILAAEHGATINAVAPGFIETQMTAAMPFAIREAGRRMNSLLQGGRPCDVAETIAWLASPGSASVNGNVVRVCGQSLLGA